MMRENHKIKSFGLVFCLFLMTLFISQCDSNRLSSGGGNINPDASEPTQDVAKNAGPVADLVTTDVLNKANDIRSNLFDYVDALLGNREGSFLIFSIDDPDNRTFTTTLDFSESEQSCDEGGTRTIGGSGTLTFDGVLNEGTISNASFTITYSNCQDIILMETSNGNCTITPTVDGEVEVLVQSDIFLSSSIYIQEIDDESNFDATSTDLDVSVDNTASIQTYNFSYDFYSNSLTENFSGIVDYNNDLYDLNMLEDFIPESTTTAICN